MVVDPARLVFANQAQTDAGKLSAAGLKSKAKELLDLNAENPYQVPSGSEKLAGNLSGAISRRINIHHAESRRMHYAIRRKES